VNQSQHVIGVFWFGVDPGSGLAGRDPQSVVGPQTHRFRRDDGISITRLDDDVPSVPNHGRTRGHDLD